MLSRFPVFKASSSLCRVQGPKSPHFHMGLVQQSCWLLLLVQRESPFPPSTRISRSRVSKRQEGFGFYCKLSSQFLSLSPDRLFLPQSPSAYTSLQLRLNQIRFALQNFLCNGFSYFVKTWMACLKLGSKSDAFHRQGLACCVLMLYTTELLRHPLY
ncbi:hypothetical protein M5K25_017782 [Dendrobium thyrsiflorum]|uniref:Uncharacterized protein n=1 Tax=Dendrobium thyrsiflorum TaxID=117978 RepID=A0ABD0UH91_DENTH